jgi:hypothetical protein
MTPPMTLPSVLADNPRLDRWLNFATPGKVELATGQPIDAGGRHRAA